MSKENLFAKAIAGRKKESVEATDTTENTEPSQVLEQPDAAVGRTEPKPSLVKPDPSTQKRGRGRPATGKRSNDDWIGRTYYIQRDTDLDIEDELLKLKRQGIEVDKSELVDLLLSAWVKWQQGENIEIQISEITPRRKSKPQN